jgi:carbamoyltransferase
VNIIGVSAYYHDSAACLVQDGEITAAAQEERFSRKKHDHRFPKGAFDYCLKAGGLKGPEDVDYVVFYDKPLMKFERLLETYLAYAPHGVSSFLKSMPLWLKEKLHIRTEIRKACGYEGKILFGEHHESHAASAYYPSTFDEAAIICFDGVGEWATTSYWVGKGNKLESRGEILFPHSIGLLYSAFTYYTGFKVNSGEYKVMGLAPYGVPKYVDAIYEHILDLRDDGSFHLNMDYFDYCAGLTMTNAKFDAVFGGPPRKPEARLSQREMDLAASVQRVTEDAMLRIARHVHNETGLDNLCLAGGVALNCVGNGRLLREGPFKKIFIQPAAGDAGGAVGAALAVWHRYLDKPRATFTGSQALDRQRGSYLGPSYGDADVQKVIDARGAKAERLDDAALLPKVAKLLSEGKIVGWVSGRMEFGPRALGGRSILGDARDPEMQKRMNLKIKFRESFRPFAPSVLAEHVSEWFDIDRESPYMLLVAEVAKKQQIPMTAEQEKLFGIEKLNVPRSTIPAATHVDYSARIQTVHRETNPRYHALISEFHKLTGCPVVVNTSFNVRGEPIVCGPEDAYRCFMRSDIDVLVVDQWIFMKEDQPVVDDDKKWMQEFELD